MKLAALYSGGKDSAFALYIAEQTGHDVTHLVNIVSGEEGSWIFHVPNQSLVPLMAEAMNKKLITVSTDGSENGDMNALRLALNNIDAEGVIIGTVRSDYQWERINTVCDELGLMAMAPLWKKDQRTVLNEIIDSGIKAIIIGAYADGFDETWLGRTIDSDAADELMKLHEKHGISVIGEGGEYESLVTDSPIQSSSIKINAFEKEWKNGSGTMHVTAATLIPKAGNVPKIRNDPKVRIDPKARN